MRPLIRHCISDIRDWLVLQYCTSSSATLSLHIGKFCKMPIQDGAHKLSDPYAIFFMFMRIREPIVRFHHQKEQQECLHKGYYIVSMMM